MTKVGRVPVRGALVSGPGAFEIEVVDADPRRVKRVRIYRRVNRPAARDGDGKRRLGATAADPAKSAAAAPATEVPPPPADTPRSSESTS